MKILTAVDTFKGSISSSETNNIVATALRNKSLEVIEKPLADGGEGTIDALIDARKAQKIECQVTDVLGQKSKCYYAMMADQTAVIEVAQICGLPVVPLNKRDPMTATTYGVGEALLHAVKQGAEQVVIALGGSATNDMGVGMLQALGTTILDSSHQPVSFGAQSLKDIQHIDTSTCSPLIKHIPLSVITDVHNPLFGEDGATFVFGPQKGLSQADCIEVDKEIQRLCDITPVLEKFQNTPGAGAAGGLGAACLVLGAQIFAGAEWFMEILQIKETIQHVDVVITGEGQLDSQTLSGKAPIQIARYANSLGKPVIAIAGSIDIDILNDFYGSGIKSCLSVMPGIQTLEAAMTLSQAEKNIDYISQQIAAFMTWKDH